MTKNMHHPVSKIGELGVLRGRIQRLLPGVHHPITSPPFVRSTTKTGRKVSPHRHKWTRGKLGTGLNNTQRKMSEVAIGFWPKWGSIALTVAHSTEAVANLVPVHIEKGRQLPT